MMNLLFNEPQNYAWVLNYGRRLIEAETKDAEKNRTEHQINTRIFNNAFCGLLRTGYPFDITTITNQMFVRLILDGKQFQCPANTVSNILRQEYDTIVRPKVDRYNQREKTEQEECEIAELEVRPVSEPDKKEEQIQIPKTLKEASSDLKITPAKQMEIMRGLKEDRELRTGENSGEQTAKEDCDHASTKVTVPLAVQDQVNDEAAAPKVFQPQMRMPVLDDVMFAPAKHGKTIEIDEAEETSVDNEKIADQAIEEKMKVAVVPEPVLKLVFTAELERNEEEVTKSKGGSLEEETEAPQTLSDAIKEGSVDTADAPPHSETSGSVTTADRETTTAASEVAYHDLLKDLSENTSNSPMPESAPSETIIETPAHAPTGVNPANESNYGMPESSDAAPKRVFQPKAQRFAPVVSFNETMPKTSREVPAAPAAPKEKKGFLSSIFSGGERKKDVAESSQNPNPEDTFLTDTQGEAEAKIIEVIKTPISDEVMVEPDVSYAPAVKREMPSTVDTQLPSLLKDKTESYNHDGGKIFTHVHQVTLKKQFGNNSVGPYRFIFWPMYIVEMQSKKTWADFLVHVTDQNGNEILLCTDGVYKELIVKVDGRELNVYATWTNGVFESHISPYGKTASIFTIEDEVFKEEPEEAEHDGFLDQFRLERKGQPKHFIVPFKNNNRGELNIPIVGCVELGGKRYPLERREENTLRYRYHGSDKIIRGHWERGVFKFTVDDANRFVWEEEHDE